MQMDWKEIWQQFDTWWELKQDEVFREKRQRIWKLQFMAIREFTENRLDGQSIDWKGIWFDLDKWWGNQKKEYTHWAVQQRRIQLTINKEIEKCSVRK